MQTVCQESFGEECTGFFEFSTKWLLSVRKSPFFGPLPLRPPEIALKTAWKSSPLLSLRARLKSPQKLLEFGLPVESRLFTKDTGYVRLLRALTLWLSESRRNFSQMWVKRNVTGMMLRQNHAWLVRSPAEPLRAGGRANWIRFWWNVIAMMFRLTHIENFGSGSCRTILCLAVHHPWFRSPPWVRLS